MLILRIHTTKQKNERTSLSKRFEGAGCFSEAGGTTDHIPENECLIFNNGSEDEERGRKRGGGWGKFRYSFLGNSDLLFRANLITFMY